MQTESLCLTNLGSVIQLPLSSIRRSKFVIRQEMRNIEELAQSIREKGLLSPIIVRVTDERSTYELVAGSRRLEAVRTLGMGSIQGFVTELDDRSVFEVLIAENVQRETLTPLEEARAFYAYVGPKERNCLSYGRISDLAKRIGKSQEYVSTRLSLLRLPEKLLQDLFRQKHFTVSHAEELASLADNPVQVEELSALVVSQKISVRDLERIIPLIKSGIGTRRAVELAEIESDLKLNLRYCGAVEDSNDVLLKRAKFVLESALSYIDNAGRDLESDAELYRYWLDNVRIKVHGAIDGVISCEKILQKKNSPTSGQKNHGPNGSLDS